MMWKPIDRRTVLRGVGATLALPWLEAMQPATAGIAASTSGLPPRRLAMMYIPNGVIGDHWFPSQTEPGFELPASLKPLEELRDQITIISNLKRTYLAGEPHSQAGSCWLTSAPPNQRRDGVTAIDTTLDQIIARQQFQETSFASIELSCNRFSDNAEPKIFDAISWYGPGNDAKSLNDPRRVFKRLFGQAETVDRSVLDTVLEDARQLQGKLGQADRRKVDEYLDSVRSIERRLSRQSLAEDGIQTVDFELPDPIPTDRGKFIRLMGDLMVLAFQTDRTRIATMMVGPERWETPQRYEGVFDVPVNHHVMTHDHAYDEMVAKIDRFHVQQYAYLIRRLNEIQEGETTLLDQCCFVLGSGIGDGATHSYEKLPLLIAGTCGQQIRPGRHLQADEGTPLANLWVTVADMMGVHLDSFADSQGRLELG